MSSDIRNVEMGSWLCDVSLATSGINTCLAVVVHLDNNTTIIAHLSSQWFDIETKDPPTAIQTLIERIILEVIQMKANNSAVKNVFIVGGLSNDEYGQFNTELELLKKSLSTVVPLLKQSNVNDLHSFIQSIEYSNFTMNIGAELNSDGEDDNPLTFISDLTIVFEGRLDRPMLFMVQYFDIEDNLRGDLREFKPWIIYLYDFNLKCWNVLNQQPPHHADMCAVESILKQFDKDKTYNLSSNNPHLIPVDQIESILKNIKY